MSKTSFLGSVATGKSPQQAVTSLLKAITPSSQSRRIMSFSGKSKTYSVLIAGSLKTVPFNPYSGRLNLKETGISGQSVSKVIDFSKSQGVDFKASAVKCSSCAAYQVSDNSHLVKKCVICSGDMVEPEKDELDNINFSIADEDILEDHEETTETDEVATDMEEEVETAGPDKSQFADEEDELDADVEEYSLDEDPLADKDATEVEAGKVDVMADATIITETEAEASMVDDVIATTPEIVSHKKIDNIYTISASRSVIKSINSKLTEAGLDEDPLADKDATEVEAGKVDVMADATIITETEAEASMVDDVIATTPEIVSHKKIDNIYTISASRSVIKSINSKLTEAGKAVSCATIKTSSREERVAVRKAVTAFKKSVSSVSHASGTYKIYASVPVLNKIKAQLTRSSDEYVQEDVNDDTIADVLDTSVEELDSDAPDELEVVEEAAQDTEEVVEEAAQDTEEVVTDTEEPEEQDTMDEDQLVEVDMLEEGINRDATIVSNVVDFVFKDGTAVDGSRWYALVDNTPVAFATHHSAGRNSEIFHTDKFKIAASAVLSQGGVYRGLKEMGFSGINVKLPIKSVVENKIEAAKRSAMVSASNQLNEFRSGIYQALSTAAVGLNKGFFADTRSPLKVSLYNTLSSLGLQNAEHVIDEAFAKCGEDHHKVLMEKAIELVDMPEVAFNELSTAVASATYQRAATASVSSMVSSHLMGNNMPHATVPQTQVSTSADSSDEAVSAQMKSVINGFVNKKLN